MPHRPLKTTRWPRVFSCGCTIHGTAGIRNRRNGIYCTAHDGHLIGFEVTCVDCGRRQLVPPSAGRRKYCDACFRRRYRPCKGVGRGGGQAPEELPPEDQAYIRSHPWLSTAELARHLAISYNQARTAQRAAGIAGKHPSEEAARALRRFYALGAATRRETATTARKPTVDAGLQPPP